MIRRCAQYVTRQAKRVPCDRPCLTFCCGQHGGRDAFAIEHGQSTQHRRTVTFRNAEVCVEVAAGMINVTAVLDGRRDAGEKAVTETDVA